MAQLEYGDYYKFVASAGIALLAAAFFLPWMFLREPFDLAIEASKLALLTPEAQGIIRERQHLITISIEAIPYVSGCFGVLGFFMTGLGLRKWNERQSIRDKGEDLGVEKLSRELQEMSPDEIKASAQEEIESIEDQPSAAFVADSSAPVNAYLAVEGAVLRRISECFGPSMKLMRNQRLAGIEYDAIIRDRESGRIVVEIKYIRKGFRHGWLIDSINNLAAKTALYSNTFSHETRGVLIIVLATSDPSLPQRVLALTEQFRLTQPQRFSDLHIHTIEEHEIANMPCDAVRRLLG
jgi:hypothetical protein